MKPKPRRFERRVSSEISSLTFAFSCERRPICVSFAWACFAFVFLYLKRSTKRSSRAMSSA